MTSEAKAASSETLAMRVFRCISVIFIGVCEVDTHTLESCLEICSAYNFTGNLALLITIDKICYQ